MQIPFKCVLSVRVGDLNYGNHLGNDRLVGFLHEARLQWLASMGCSELDVGDGISLILSELQVSYRAQGFLGDRLSIELRPQPISKARFDLLYTVKRDETNQEETIVATATTTLAFFDYPQQRIARMPATFQQALEVSS